jgi:hypothetical protein
VNKKAVKGVPCGGDATPRAQAAGLFDALDAAGSTGGPARGRRCRARRPWKARCPARRGGAPGGGPGAGGRPAGEASPPGNALARGQ